MLRLALNPNVALSIKLLFLAGLLSGLSCNADTLTGRVVGVADGDTITVLDANKVQHKVRLASIDAPEKKQPFGNRSKESLSELAFDKTVTAETDKRDKYGQQVGKVLVDRRDVNVVQIERGMAWFYRQYQRELSPNDRRLYEAAGRYAAASTSSVTMHPCESLCFVTEAHRHLSCVWSSVGLVSGKGGVPPLPK